MTHWSTLADKIWDSDGDHPDAETLVQLMREFRSCGCMTDFYFVDISQDQNDPQRFRDAWNNDALRPSWDCGPEPRDIDFSGLDA